MGNPAVNIGEVIAHGVMFDPKNGARLRNMDLNQLFDAIPRLFDLLEEREIDYVLVGGIAMLVYVEGRNTQDIDLIISRDGLSKLPELIVEDDSPNFARCSLGDLQVDLLFISNILFERVRQKHVAKQEFVNRAVPCATAEGLVLLKLFVLPSLYRQGRFDRVRAYEKDVADLLASFSVPLEEVFAELGQHLAPSDSEELRSIVTKIETEIADSKRRFTADE